MNLQLNDPLFAVPEEIGLQILAKLDSESLSSARLVSKLWKRLSSDDQVWWRKLCFENGIYSIQQGRAWQDQFREWKRAEDNAKNGQFRTFVVPDAFLSLPPCTVGNHIAFLGYGTECVVLWDRTEQKVSHTIDLSFLMPQQIAWVSAMVSWRDSDNRELLVIAARHFITVWDPLTPDKEVKRWTLANDVVSVTVVHHKAVSCLAACYRGNGDVTIFDGLESDSTQTLTHGGNVVQVLGVGARLAVLSADDRLTVWEFRDSQFEQSWSRGAVCPKGHFPAYPPPSPIASLGPFLVGPHGVHGHLGLWNLIDGSVSHVSDQVVAGPWLRIENNVVINRQQNDQVSCWSPSEHRRGSAEAHTAGLAFIPGLRDRVVRKRTIHDRRAGGYYSLTLGDFRGTQQREVAKSDQVLTDYQAVGLSAYQVAVQVKELGQVEIWDFGSPDAPPVSRDEREALGFFSRFAFSVDADIPHAGGTRRTRIRRRHPLRVWTPNNQDSLVFGSLAIMIIGLGMCLYAWRRGWIKIERLPKGDPRLQRWITIEPIPEKAY